MRFKLFAVFVLLLFGVGSASAWTNTGGGDHGGANWTPADALTIGGVHYNIGTFTVTTGYTVNINSGAVFTVYADTVIVDGTINGNARGYAGGLHRAQDLSGYPGAGTGAGGGGEGWASDSSAGAGGGGAGFGGAGLAGSDGFYSDGGTAGSAYSTATAYENLMGSGGGAGGSGYHSSALGGDGGNGGAGIALNGRIVSVTGTITANGEDGDDGSDSYTGGGGAGSGGGILLFGNDVTATGTLSCNGAVKGAVNTAGGNSGGGRIKIFYSTSINTTGITTSVLAGAGATDGSYNTILYGNEAPTTPTITAPLNDTIQSDNPLALVANSTDAEGDYLTYYFYGDAVDGSNFLGTSSNGTFYWDPTYNEYNYWKVRAADFNSSSSNTSVYQFYYIPTPTLQIPVNASTQTLPYPPLLNEITFAWESTGATAYKYQIATDEDFNLIYLDDVITSNTTVQSMQIDTYYWRVAAYSTVVEDYSDWSNAWEFTINETNGGEAVTAIDGVVYEITTAGSIAVDGGLVNIWNSTWSDSMLVGQNGYYYFDGAKDGTYSVRATKTGYTDSSIELVTVQALNTTTRNILLQDYTGAGQQYVDHYVKFIVKSLTGALYSDVEVNVYLGDAVIPQYTGTTGTDGSVAFELNEYQEYRITFEKTSPSIDKEITIYPKDDSYTVYVDIGTMIDDLLNPDDEDQAITAIDVSVTKTIINDNTANITVNFNDIMDETSGLTLTLSQSIAGNTTNKTVLSTVDLGTTNNTAYNFTVTNYNGESYLIEIDATHTTHGAIYRMYGIQFENTDTLFGFTVEVVGWLAIIFITWFALTATSVTVPHTAIGVCSLATVMMAIGWGSYISVPGLGLAWIMSLAANFAQAKEASA